MKQRRLFYILFFCLAVFIIGGLHFVNSHSLKSIGIKDERYRAMDLRQFDFTTMTELAYSGVDATDCMLISLYYDLPFKENVRWDNSDLVKYRNQMMTYYEDYQQMKSYLQKIVEDMKYFPVAHSTLQSDFVEFENSWGYERLYGGKRFHEGCDMMATKNVRGVYPIVSVSDGVVEKLGWLEKGGYRVGIRSNNGIYYYYAHLAEYAAIKEGDVIRAGDVIGFMGDTGYSTVEGTVGNFDVHLHFGIYIDDSEGEEISINPYYFLRFLLNKVLYFEYVL